MDASTAMIAIKLIDLLLRVGIPAFVDLVGELKGKKEITLEDIQSLHDRVKKPDTFLKGV